MALRLLTYVGMLYQDLVRTKQLTGSGRLPPVLPIVLYNGVRAWTASQEIAELIEPVPAAWGITARTCAICFWTKAASA